MVKRENKRGLATFSFVLADSEKRSNSKKINGWISSKWSMSTRKTKEKKENRKGKEEK